MYTDAGQAYGDNVIDIIIKSFTVLTNHVPCTSHMNAIASKTSIDTSSSASNMKDMTNKFSMSKTFVRRATSNIVNYNLKFKRVSSTR